MEQYQVILTVSGVLLSYAGAACPNKQNYGRVVELDNRNVTTPVLETSVSQHPGMFNCSRRCFYKPGCRCLRLRGDECTLYSSHCRETDGLDDTQPGALYYSNLDPCLVHKGYMLVISARLCIKMRTEHLNWSQSQNQCRSDGGRLIVLDTQDKCDSIKQFLEGKKDIHAWVGMTRLDGEFKWVDVNDTSGETCDGNQETNGFDGDCMCMFAVGRKMRPANCTLPRRGFLCEIDMQT